ncbi:MAG: hypothetical protein OXE40_11580 [Gammaproteobacteria bacterium]|nr:hypothetical protein [Gammaproteobacteria bacterium]
MTGRVTAGPGDNSAIGPPLHVIDLNPRKTGYVEFRGPALDHCRRKRPAKMRRQPDAGGAQALEKRRIGKRRAVSIGMNENTPFDGISLTQCLQIANRPRIVNTRKCNECGFQMTRQHRRQSEIAAGDEGDRNPAESRFSTPGLLELTKTPSPATVDRQTVVTAQRPFSSSLERPGLMSMGPSSMLAKAFATAMKPTGPLTHSVRRTIQATGANHSAQHAALPQHCRRQTERPGYDHRTGTLLCLRQQPVEGSGAVGARQHLLRE